MFPHSINPRENPYKTSSPLEVQIFDSECKHKGKEHGECDFSSSNPTQEIMLVSEVILNVLLHCFPLRNHEVLIVSELWNTQAIQGPRHWACPEVPPPPYGYPLHWVIKPFSTGSENRTKRRNILVLVGLNFENLQVEEPRNPRIDSIWRRMQKTQSRQCPSLESGRPPSSHSKWSIGKCRMWRMCTKRIWLQSSQSLSLRKLERSRVQTGRARMESRRQPESKEILLVAEKQVRLRWIMVFFVVISFLLGSI